MKPWLKECWVIPPEANAEFICQMEDVLDIYQRSYDPKYPVVCFDESNKQLVKEIRTPIPMKAACLELEKSGVNERLDS